MPQIENMAAPIPVSRQYLAGLPADDFRWCQQRSRVEISLQRHTIAYAGARLSDIDGPIETQRIGSALREALQP